MDNLNDPSTGKLACSMIGELLFHSFPPPLLGKAGPTPHHRHGSTGHSPDIGGPSTLSEQPSYHQIYIQGFEWALSNIYPIYDLLECMKGLVLWNLRHRISITGVISRMFKRSFSEGPVLTMYQKPEELNLDNHTLNNEHLQVKLCEPKCILHDTQQLPMTPRWMKRWYRGEKTEEQNVLFVFTLVFLFDF